MDKNPGAPGSQVELFNQPEFCFESKQYWREVENGESRCRVMSTQTIKHHYTPQLCFDSAYKVSLFQKHISMTNVKSATSQTFCALCI